MPAEAKARRENMADLYFALHRSPECLEARAIKENTWSTGDYLRNQMYAFFNSWYGVRDGRIYFPWVQGNDTKHKLIKRLGWVPEAVPALLMSMMA